MEILAKSRQIKKTNLNQSRKDGFIPGIVFSKKSSQGETETHPILLNVDDFKKVYAEAGESTLVEIKIDEDKSVQVLISEVQRHPITWDFMHVAFYQVDLTEKITADIPIELVNEDAHPVVKAGDGIIITTLSEIEVRCLPQDLPSEFTVDVLALKEVGDVLTIADAINVDPEKVELLAEQEEVIVKLDYAEQLEVVDEEEPRDVDDVEVETKGKKEDGEEGDESESESAPADDAADDS